MHFLNHHFRRQNALIPAEHGGGFIAKSPRSGCPNLAIGNKTHQLGSNWGRIPKIWWCMMVDHHFPHGLWAILHLWTNLDIRWWNIWWINYKEQTRINNRCLSLFRVVEDSWNAVNRKHKQVKAQGTACWRWPSGCWWRVEWWQSLWYIYIYTLLYIYIHNIIYMYHSITLYYSVSYHIISYAGVCLKMGYTHKIS